MPYIYKPHKHISIPYIKEDSDSSKYYNSKYWKRLRNTYIIHHPLCEDCMLEGISTAADEVHHIKPFMSVKDDTERWNLLLDPNNLVSLCLRHHHERHKQLKKS